MPEGTASINGVLQFLTIVVIFIVVLAITVLATKWLANYQKAGVSGSNIQILETSRLANNKYIQIVRIGSKHLAVAVGKDEVTFLAELDADSLEYGQGSNAQALDFKSVMAKLTKTQKGDSQAN